MGEIVDIEDGRVEIKEFRIRGGIFCSLIVSLVDLAEIVERYENMRAYGLRRTAFVQLGMLRHQWLRSVDCLNLDCWIVGGMS